MLLVEVVVEMEYVSRNYINQLSPLLPLFAFIHSFIRSFIVFFFRTIPSNMIHTNFKGKKRKKSKKNLAFL